MHELSVTEQILTTVLDFGRENAVQKILCIHLHIGALCELEEEPIQFYLDSLSKGTLAANAKIKIKKLPVYAQCRDCSHEFLLEIAEKYLCPKCTSPRYRLIKSMDYWIENMEVL